MSFQNPNISFAFNPPYLIVCYNLLYLKQHLFFPGQRNYMGDDEKRCVSTNPPSPSCHFNC